MLRTRAPVATKLLLIRDAPRLACVKPIASVHPEPGSNSSLLSFPCLTLNMPVAQMYIYKSFRIDGKSFKNKAYINTPHNFLILHFCCFNISMTSVFSIKTPRPPKVLTPRNRIAKVILFYSTTKLFSIFFIKKISLYSQYAYYQQKRFEGFYSAHRTYINIYLHLA